MNFALMGYRRVICQYLQQGLQKEDFNEHSIYVTLSWILALLRETPRSASSQTHIKEAKQ